jgi:hypothetical protein
MAKAKSGEGRVGQAAAMAADDRRIRPEEGVWPKAACRRPWRGALQEMRCGLLADDSAVVRKTADESPANG